MMVPSEASEHRECNEKDFTDEDINYPVTLKAGCRNQA